MDKCTFSEQFVIFATANICAGIEGESGHSLSNPCPFCFVFDGNIPWLVLGAIQTTCSKDLKRTVKRNSGYTFKFDFQNPSLLSDHCEGAERDYGGWLQPIACHGLHDGQRSAGTGAGTGTGSENENGLVPIRGNKTRDQSSRPFWCSGQLRKGRPSVEYFWRLVAWFLLSLDNPNVKDSYPQSRESP